MRWPRWVELLLGAWLVASAFVLRHESVLLLGSAIVSGMVTIGLAAMSFEGRRRRAHLAELVVACWLVAVGWAASRVEPTAPAQNHLVVGLLLLMFAILPTESTLPPRSWRRRWEEA